MCDRYSIKYGYICNDCFNELVRLGLSVDIGEFMRSNKRDTDEVSSLYFYDEEFKLQY